MKASKVHDGIIKSSKIYITIKIDSKDKRIELNITKNLP